MSDFIADSEYVETKNLLQAQRKKYLMRTAVLIVLNILLFTFFIEDGTSKYNRFVLSLQACTYSFAFIGFIIGAIVALFPYKKLNYRRKYLRSSLLSMYIIQIIMFIGCILAAITLLWTN
jgi:uncharacterized membrane protein YphA (DoxX/SURF4 family)